VTRTATLLTGLVLLIVPPGVASLAQASQSPAARDGGAPLIENDRVVIREMTWERGRPAPVYEGARDAVIVRLADGSVTFRERGAGRFELPVTETSPRAIVIELASSSPAGSAPAPGHPSSFPRRGASQLIDNRLVKAWTVTWPNGEPTAMHTHPFPTISVTLVGGRQRETRLDGTSSERTVGVGEVRFSEAGRIHREEGLADPPRRAVIVELK
jgi:quercetin dioxygenase-like cupin family protein